ICSDLLPERELAQREVVVSRPELKHVRMFLAELFSRLLKRVTNSEALLIDGRSLGLQLIIFLLHYVSGGILADRLYHRSGENRDHVLFNVVAQRAIWTETFQNDIQCLSELDVAQSHRHRRVLIDARLL